MPAGRHRRKQSSRRQISDVPSLTWSSSPVLSTVDDLRQGEGRCAHPATPGSNDYSLLRLDAGILDDLAPARFLAEKIPVEHVWRLGHHHEALIDAKLFEGIGLHGFRGR